MITYESYGHIKLTDKGIEYSKKILADYDILYIFLHDVIGVDEDVSMEDASKIKGVIIQNELIIKNKMVWSIIFLKYKSVIIKNTIR